MTQVADGLIPRLADWEDVHSHKMHWWEILQPKRSWRPCSKGEQELPSLKPLDVLLRVTTRLEHGIQRLQQPTEE